MGLKSLTDLPNIGTTLAKKLQLVGIMNEQDLTDTGSEKALLQIASLKKSGVCLNMLYALEGAIQNKRWHSLDKLRKEELKEFFHQLNH